MQQKEKSYVVTASFRPSVCPFFVDLNLNLISATEPTVMFSHNSVQKSFKKFAKQV
jgi:hypothetical protein